MVRQDALRRPDQSSDLEIGAVLLQFLLIELPFSVADLLERDALELFVGHDRLEATPEHLLGPAAGRFFVNARSRR